MVEREDWGREESSRGSFAGVSRSGGSFSSANSFVSIASSSQTQSPEHAGFDSGAAVLPSGGAYYNPLQHSGKMKTNPGNNSSISNSHKQRSWSVTSGSSMDSGPLGLAHYQRSEQPSPFQPITEHEVRIGKPGSASSSSKKKKKKKKKKAMSHDVSMGANGEADSNEPVRCFNCDDLGHLSRDCTKPRACFLCGLYTHVAKNCELSALKDEEKESNGTGSVIAHVFQTENNGLDESASNEKQLCLNCNEPGHRLKNCPHARKCFRCGNSGHVARECPEVSELEKLRQKQQLAEGKSETGAPQPTQTYRDDEFAEDHFPQLPVNFGCPPQRKSGSFTDQRRTPSPFNFTNFSMAGAAQTARGGGATSVPLPSQHQSLNMRPESCSPPLFLGGGAFSSFSASAATTDTSTLTAYTLEGELEDEVEEAQYQDLVSNLLTDLDLEQN